MPSPLPGANGLAGADQPQRPCRHCAAVYAGDGELTCSVSTAHVGVKGESSSHGALSQGSVKAALRAVKREPALGVQDACQEGCSTTGWSLLEPSFTRPYRRAGSRRSPLP